MATDPDLLYSAVYGNHLITLSDRNAFKHWRDTSALLDISRSRFKEAILGSITGTTMEVGKRGLMSYVRDVMMGRTIDIGTWNIPIGSIFMANLQNSLAKAVKDIVMDSARLYSYGSLFDLSDEEALVFSDRRLEDFAEEYTARVIWNLNDTSFHGMNALIRTMADRGASESMIVKAFPDHFGLDQRWIYAGQNYRKGIEAQNKNKTFVERLYKRYLLKAVDHRSEAFARTESATALNFGRQMVYEKLVLDGKLPQGTKKVWVTGADERVCPICAPMDKTAVPLTHQFETEVGKVMVPPVHPNCRCMIIPDAFLNTLAEFATRSKIRNRSRKAA